MLYDCEILCGALLAAERMALTSERAPLQREAAATLRPVTVWYHLTSLPPHLGWLYQEINKPFVSWNVLKTYCLYYYCVLIPNIVHCCISSVLSSLHWLHNYTWLWGKNTICKVLLFTIIAIIWIQSFHVHHHQKTQSDRSRSWPSVCLSFFLFSYKFWRIRKSALTVGNVESSEVSGLSRVGTLMFPHYCHCRMSHTWCSGQHWEQCEALHQVCYKILASESLLSAPDVRRSTRLNWVMIGSLQIFQNVLHSQYRFIPAK